MNFSDIAVLILLLAAIAFTIRRLIKNKRLGRSPCGCDCGSCRCDCRKK